MRSVGLVIGSRLAGGDVNEMKRENEREKARLRGGSERGRERESVEWSSQVRATLWHLQPCLNPPPPPCHPPPWQAHDTATAHHDTPLHDPLNHSLDNHMLINFPLSPGHIHHVNSKYHHTAGCSHPSRNRLDNHNYSFFGRWQFFMDRRGRNPSIASFCRSCRQGFSVFFVAFSSNALANVKIVSILKNCYNYSLVLMFLTPHSQHAEWFVFNHADVLVLCSVGWKLCASF